MKKFIGVAGAVAAAALSFSSVAQAEDRQFSYSFTIGGTSDYVFRGLSFNNEDPAAQGAVDFTYGIFYAGAWASNLDVGTGYEPYELDLYTGIKPKVGNFEFDFGIIGYLYPDADVGGDTNYVELKAGVSTAIQNISTGVTFFYTPDSDNYGETFTVEGSLGYEFRQVGIFTPSVSGLIGYTEDMDNLGLFSSFTDDYVYWNAGLSLAVENFTMDFRYWDTDLDQIAGDAYTGLSDERFVFSASVSLP